MSATWFRVARRVEVRRGEVVRELPGVVVRRDPKGDPPKGLGPDPVNIEAKGVAAESLIGLALAVPEEPAASRLDYCFDFRVGADVTPRQVVRAAGWREADRGLWLEGQAERASVYLFRSSQRSTVIVYRRDWKEGTPETEPTMRIEVRAKRDLAPQWMGAMRKGSPGVLRKLALAELAERFGLRLAEDAGPKAPAPVRPPASVLRACAMALRQYGAALRLMDRHGVSAAEVLEVVEADGNPSAVAKRKRAERERRRDAELEGLSGASLRDAIVEELRRLEAKEVAVRG